MTIARLWALAVIVAVSTLAAAQQAMSPTSLLATDPQHGKVLFLKRCAECHGRHGWGDGPREIPALAGQGEKYLIEQLNRFASGQRPGSKMHGPAMRDSTRPPDVNRAQAIADLSSYLTRAPRDPQPEYGQQEALASGKLAYARACQSCHRVQGAGDDAQRIPAVGGQHYSYLASRLHEFSSGQMSHPPGMAALTAEDQRALADYISRLPYLGAPPDR